MRYILLVIVIALSTTASGQAHLADELVQIHPVTTTEMNAIVTPVDGSLVYNTIENTIYQRASNIWVPFTTSPSVYTGFFIIDNTTLKAAGTYTQPVTVIPFKPSQVTFVTNANVESLNIDWNNGVRNNDRYLDNSYGKMNGFARNTGGRLVQQVMCSGNHRKSINDISRFVSSSNCIGVRYGDQNGSSLDKIEAVFDAFTVDYTDGVITNNSGMR